MSDHPMQPVEFDADGVIRFKKNAIVKFLQEWASQKGMDMNALRLMPFTAEDWTQFCQLIGYSVSGFGDLSFVDKDVVHVADMLADKLRKPEPELTPVGDDDHVMSIAEFKASVESGFFTDDDGFGHYAKVIDGHVSESDKEVDLDDIVAGRQAKKWTHVVWYNK